MIKPLLILVTLTITMPIMARTCTPEVLKPNPPRLVNGEWIKADKPSHSEMTKMDFEKLKKKKFTFIFSGIYTKEVSFSKKALSYIQTKKIWQGKVTDTVDVNMEKLPKDNKCSKMKYDQEYIFFGTLGSRNNPLILKEFRKSTPELKALLGKATKQWLRGRLIHSRN